MNQHHDIKENGNASLGFWLKIAGLTFGAWSVMVPVAVWILSRNADGIATRVEEHITREETGDRANAAEHADLQHRLTTLESSHQDVLRRLAEVETENRQEEELINRMRKGREP